MKCPACLQDSIVWSYRTSKGLCFTQGCNLEIKEIKKEDEESFITFLRERKIHEHYEKLTEPLLSLMLKEYSQEECLLAVFKVKPLPIYQIALISILLFNRTYRGNETLEDAIELLEKCFLT